MDWQRIEFPSLSPAFVAASNELAKIATPIDLDAGWSVLPSPANDGAAVRLTLDLDFGGSRLLAHLNAAALELALGELISKQAFEALERELQLAVLEATLDRPLAALGARFGVAVRLLDIRTGRDGPDGVDAQTQNPCNCWAFEGRDSSQQAQLTAQVEFLDPLPASVSAALASVELRCRNLDHLPFPVRFEVGRTSVSVAEFEGLETGDVLLLDECHLTDDGLRVNVCGMSVWQGRLERLNLTVQEAVT